MTISCFTHALLVLQTQQPIIRVETILLPLAAALGLALVVERVLEFLKNLVDAMPTHSAGHVVDNAEDSAKPTDDLKKFYAAAESQSDHEWNEEHPPETILVQEATDRDDGITLRAFALQSVGVIIGIIAARITGLQLFDALTPSSDVPKQLDYLLTGLFIGGGSAPAHVLIRFITERKVSVPEAPARAEAPVQVAQIASAEVIAAATNGGGTVVSAVAAVAYAGSPAINGERSLDVPYAGGVDRDKLETVHRRGGDPNLVVFHHTAMPLQSTFEQVVRVIKDRKDSSGHNWITGYNCVVLADGSVHPFCRWDRYGNHAQGFNRLSLGVTLNGNFETDPKVPYSNPDGRYGSPRPTDAQLDAAARVVALWTHLYPAIPIAFPKKGETNATQGIIPHKSVSPKTCPGTMFPYEQFEKLVRHYHETWGRSPDCRARIDAYKLRPYLYADPARIPTSRWGSVAAPPAPLPPFPPASTPAIPPGAST